MSHQHVAEHTVRMPSGRVFETCCCGGTRVTHPAGTQEPWQVVRLLNMPAVINQHMDGQLEPRETVIDLLTELLHFAGDKGVNFDEALDMARWNYREEKEEDAGDN